MSNYRILFVPAIEKSAIETFTVQADTLNEARMKLSLIADYTFHLHKKGLMRDYSNFGTVEQFIDGEWREVEDDSLTPAMRRGSPSPQGLGYAVC